MSTCKITYNGNEISSVDETAPVSVAYNSATIATLNDGDTKTLGCNGKVMASDAVYYTHLRAHETKANLVCRLLLEKKKRKNIDNSTQKH